MCCSRSQKYPSIQLLISPAARMDKVTAAPCPSHVVVQRVERIIVGASLNAFVISRHRHGIYGAVLKILICILTSDYRRENWATFKLNCRACEKFQRQPSTDSVSLNFVFWGYRTPYCTLLCAPTLPNWRRRKVNAKAKRTYPCAASMTVSVMTMCLNWGLAELKASRKTDFKKGFH